MRAPGLVKYTRKAARAAGKPVIALKLGASEGGRAAAKAHAGARTRLKLAIPRCAIPTASSKWRAIPRDLPPKSSVYDYFDLWTCCDACGCLPPRLPSATAALFFICE